MPGKRDKDYWSETGKEEHQIQKEERKIMIQDARVRNAVEGKIGEGKRKYGLGLIRGKVKETSETMIAFAMIAIEPCPLVEGLIFSFFPMAILGRNRRNSEQFRGCSTSKSTYCESNYYSLEHDDLFLTGTR